MSPGYQAAANRWLDKYHERECGAVTETSTLDKDRLARLEEAVKKECKGVGAKRMSSLFWAWRKAKVAAQQQQTLQEHHTPAGTGPSRQKTESSGCNCCLKSYLSLDCNFSSQQADTLKATLPV